jgi:hypothetical protein
MSCSNTYDKAPTQVIGKGLFLLEWHLEKTKVH